MGVRSGGDAQPSRRAQPRSQRGTDPAPVGGLPS
jgi:hypothetical protein